jgi:hypothetical protein
MRKAAIYPPVEAQNLVDEPELRELFINSACRWPVMHLEPRVDENLVDPASIASTPRSISGLRRTSLSQRAPVIYDRFMTITNRISQ